MSFRKWLQTIRSSLAPGQCRHDRRCSPLTTVVRLALESLTDRITPSFGYGGTLPVQDGQTWTADFNNDGNDDRVSGNPLLVQLGDGQGGLSAPGDFAYGGLTVLGDFTGDNIDDEVSSVIPSGVYLRAGLGGGAFGTPVLTNIPVGTCLAAIDLNWDGALDVVSAAPTMDFGGRGIVLLGRGDGTFVATEAFDLGLDVPQTSATGDFSGDGRPDVAIQGLGYDGLDTVTVLINLDDWSVPPPPPPPPSLSIGDRTVTEGHAGSVAATFTVTLSAASPSPITVAYTTGDGTAAAVSDFQAASGTLTFSPGQTSKTITVLVHGDRLGEANETFVVNLSSPTSATVADGQGVGTITDDEPRVSIGDVSKKEGNGKTTAFTFIITLSAAYDQPVTIRYATADGTATAGSDYDAAAGTITFAPGQTTKTVTVVVKGDKTKEANETFYLDLFDDSGTSLFTKNRGTGTILNDD